MTSAMSYRSDARGDPIAMAGGAGRDAESISVQKVHLMHSAGLIWQTVLFLSARMRSSCAGAPRAVAGFATSREIEGEEIVKRLNPDAEFNNLPPKRKGMHWRTYDRLTERYEAYDTLWSLEAMRRFGMNFR